MGKYIFLLLTGLVLLAGCAGGARVLVDAERKPVERVAAMVNGQAISEKELNEVLVAGYGPKVLEEMVLLAVVRQEAGRRGVTLSSEEKQAELERFLEELSPGKNRQQQEGMFAYMLGRGRLSRAEFDLILERQGLLGKMIDKNIELSEEQIGQEYERQFGRQVVVRQIVVSSFRTVQQVVERLREGSDFAELVQLYSEDQVSLGREGLLGPFSRMDEEVPQAIRESAFRLEQVQSWDGPVRFYDQKQREWWCVLRLEEVIQAEAVPLSEVRSALEEILHGRIETERKLELQKQLREQGQVRILIEP